MSVLVKGPRFRLLETKVPSPRYYELCGELDDRETFNVFLYKVRLHPKLQCVM